MYISNVYQLCISAMYISYVYQLRISAYSCISYVYQPIVVSQYRRYVYQHLKLYLKLCLKFYLIVSHVQFSHSQYVYQLYKSAYIIHEEQSGKKEFLLSLNTIQSSHLPGIPSTKAIPMNAVHIRNIFLGDIAFHFPFKAELS
ncbi:hypothetical protein DPMN_089184 [Dreissena polymorpha]|uniref:Uncharacterized protein n=1 Tax=Dreissena polymorpha TaxID=45954 RepID=A0A9D4KVG8_DREPO|nr:hypothetical protein DPMN_089184 [Dreissena polymorpha]